MRRICGLAMLLEKVNNIVTDETALAMNDFLLFLRKTRNSEKGDTEI